MATEIEAYVHTQKDPYVNIYGNFIHKCQEFGMTQISTKLLSHPPKETLLNNK